MGKGYHIYVDNWYPSPNLFDHLYRHGVHSCGTVRKNRGRFSADFTNSKFERGQTRYIQKGSYIIFLILVPFNTCNISCFNPLIFLGNMCHFKVTVSFTDGK